MKIMDILQDRWVYLPHIWLLVIPTNSTDTSSELLVGKGLSRHIWCYISEIVKNDLWNQNCKCKNKINKNTEIIGSYTHVSSKWIFKIFFKANYFLNLFNYLFNIKIFYYRDHRIYLILNTIKFSEKKYLFYFLNGLTRLKY